MRMVEEEAPNHGVAPACRVLEVARAGIYRRRQRLRALPRLDGRRKASPRAYTAHERDAILQVVNSPRFCDASVRQAVYTCQDEGLYLASPRTLYRFLQREGQSRERRNQLIHPVYQRPELLATRPNQVWSWDITRLLTFQKWTYLYLYVLLDIFSRYVVGWLMAPAESATLGSELIAQACHKQGISPGQLTIHADRGSAMRSKTVALLLSDLGVVKTHSRPHVSNDNPFSESQFKTLKYCPQFPDRFNSIQQGRLFGQSFFSWYNNQHRHSGIAYLTPSQVHYGQAQEILDARRRIVTAAATRHPERFVGGLPKRIEAPCAVWINPPNPPASLHASGTH
ncbi:MAG: IS3 family transposase [Candidatus Dormibacteraceae bacterium]